MKLKEIDKNGTLQGFVLVKSCDKKNAKNGSTYLDLTVSDADGDVSAKIWDFKGNEDDKPAVNTIILVRGTLSIYNGQPQFRIERFRPTNENDDVKISDFVPSSSLSGEVMYAQISEIIDNFKDENLQKLTRAVLEEYKDRIVELPAAFKLHHALRGGLLMHTLTICRLAQNVAAIYPSVDSDLLLSGAILHDVAKCIEFCLAPTGLVEGYSAEGTLIGHLVKGAMIIDETGKKIGIDSQTLMLVEHMLISHHGLPEYGAAIRPLFLEAEILSALDTLDADIFEIENVLKDINPGDFSTRVWSLNDRKFYNHGRREIGTDTKLLIKNDNEDNNK